MFSNECRHRQSTKSAEGKLMRSILKDIDTLLGAVFEVLNSDLTEGEKMKNKNDGTKKKSNPIFKQDDKGFWGVVRERTPEGKLTPLHPFVEKCIREALKTTEAISKLDESDAKKLCAYSNVFYMLQELNEVKESYDCRTNTLEEDVEEDEEYFVEIYYNGEHYQLEDDTRVDSEGKEVKDSRLNAKLDKLLDFADSMEEEEDEDDGLNLDSLFKGNQGVMSDRPTHSKVSSEYKGVTYEELQDMAEEFSKLHSDKKEGKAESKSSTEPEGFCCDSSKSYSIALAQVKKDLLSYFEVPFKTILDTLEKVEEGCDKSKSRLGRYERVVMLRAMCELPLPGSEERIQQRNKVLLSLAGAKALDIDIRHRFFPKPWSAFEEVVDSYLGTEGK